MLCWDFSGGIDVKWMSYPIDIEAFKNRAEGQMTIGRGRNRKVGTEMIRGFWASAADHVDWLGKTRRSI